MNNSKQTRKTFLSKEKGFLFFVVLMVIFPFAFGLLSGGGLSAGPTRFWQGQLINFFIMAVLAMSYDCLLYTSPSPRDRTRSRMPSSA